MKFIKNIFNNSKIDKLNNLSNFVSNINPQDTIIDCGANIGDIIIPYSDIGCNIIAFEPNPFAFEVLNNRFKHFDHIQCIPKAVSTKNGVSKLFFHENSDNDELLWSTGSSLFDTKVNVIKTKYINVETVNLSEYIMSINSTVKVLKLDIEGEEINVINQLIDKNIHKNIENIVVETHTEKIPSLKKETNALKKRVNRLQIKNIHFNWI